MAKRKGKTAQWFEDQGFSGIAETLEDLPGRKKPKARREVLSDVRLDLDRAYTVSDDRPGKEKEPIYKRARRLIDGLS